MKWYTEWQETTRKIMKIWQIIFIGFHPPLAHPIARHELSCRRGWAGLGWAPLSWAVGSGQPQTAPTQQLPQLWDTLISPLLDTLTQQLWIIPEIIPPSHSPQAQRRAWIAFYRCWATRNVSWAEPADQKLCSRSYLFTDEGWDL